MDAVLSALRGKETAILTTHLNADGDGCGSEIALAAWLRANGTEAFIVNPTPVPRSFSFLFPDESWILDSTSHEAQDACDGADVAVVLDTGEVPRIGRVIRLIAGLDTVVIDHHPTRDRPIQGDKGLAKLHQGNPYLRGVLSLEQSPLQQVQLFCHLAEGLREPGLVAVRRRRSCIGSHCAADADHRGRQDQTEKGDHNHPGGGAHEVVAGAHDGHER